MKWVFVRDPYYNPLLSFAGYRKVDDLEDKTISIWSKEGAPPAVPVNTALIPPHWQGLMWGTLPFGSSLLALLVFLIPEKRWSPTEDAESPATSEPVAQGRMV